MPWPIESGYPLIVVLRLQKDFPEKTDNWNRKKLNQVSPRGGVKNSLVEDRKLLGVLLIHPNSAAARASEHEEDVLVLVLSVVRTHLSSRMDFLVI